MNVGKVATKLAVGREPEGTTPTDKLTPASAYAKPQIRTKRRLAGAEAMPARNKLRLAAPRAFSHSRARLAAAGSVFINVIGSPSGRPMPSNIVNGNYLIRIILLLN
jgi:hypothetical protein